MKNRVKRAGFKSIKAYSKHIGRNPRFLYTNKNDIPANLLLDALSEIKLLKKRIDFSEELLKASKKDYFNKE